MKLSFDSSTSAMNEKIDKSQNPMEFSGTDRGRVGYHHHLFDTVDVEIFHASCAVRTKSCG